MATDHLFTILERDMRSHLVIIDGVLREDSSKVLRVERDQMISAQCRQGVGLRGVGSPGYYFPMCENPRHFRGLVPGEGIGGNQRRQMSGCGARTAAGSLEAVFESSDVERFGWILMEV